MTIFYTFFTSTSFFCSCIFFLTLFWAPCQAQLNTSPFSYLDKHKQAITVEIKHYNLPQNEKIVLYGAKRKRFITNQWYWGECGYGALIGKRSGYLEGGIISGYEFRPMPNLIVDTRLFIGAGGGGSAPQGGGKIIHATIGLGYNITHASYASVELGYIKFLNGDIESPTLAFSVTQYLWKLKAKRPHSATNMEVL